MTTVRASGSTRTLMSRKEPTGWPSRRTGTGRSKRTWVAAGAGWCGSPGGARGCRCGPGGGRRGAGRRAGRRRRRRAGRRRVALRARGSTRPATRRSWPPPPAPATSGRRATRWATKKWRRPSSSTSPRSTGKVMASGERRRASSPGPPRVRHRSPPSSPSGGIGRRPGGRPDDARASASERHDHAVVGQGARRRPRAHPSGSSSSAPRAAPTALGRRRPRRGTRASARLAGRRPGSSRVRAPPRRSGGAGR